MPTNRRLVIGFKHFPISIQLHATNNIERRRALHNNDRTRIGPDLACSTARNWTGESTFGALPAQQRAQTTAPTRRAASGSGRAV